MRYAMLVCTLALSVITAATRAETNLPKFDAAEGELRNALRELEASANAYGGHKGKAMDHIREALHEIEIARAVRG